MSSFPESSLVSGPLPWVVTGLGGFGLLVLIGARPIAGRLVLACCGGATATVMSGYLVVERWWRPFPDPVPRTVYAWAGIAIWAFGLLLVQLRRSRGWRGRLGGGIAIVTVLAMVAVQVNLVFAAYPTVEDAFGISKGNRISYALLPGPRAQVVTGSPLTTAWQAPPGLLAHGRVLRAAIPGTQSGFDARAAEIYVPPAYFTDPRPLLPVLVLLSGQPGSPIDWFHGGRLAATMDAFAATHHGLSPVTVVADATGGTWRNPLCMDSRLGNVSTYLAVDVPAWITRQLQVDPNKQRWAIGGMSYGGTCALQMATNHPQIYPTFMDLSGDPEPTLGDRAHTIDAAYGGDTAAFDRVSPERLLRTRRYPGTAGIFVVGTDDQPGLQAQRTVAAAAQTAGMSIKTRELPGGHSWSVWSVGLRIAMDWLARRLELIGGQ
ncbi:alpha/beta hydrolase [Nocardia alba]|uniref:S-formylglutathione hydrolase FrmB n=1 Tax=Nocardia alba TaxID=225051 RepID=A0A4R1FVP1_9NOCA|nr:alpha/beta hydrolase-fold protein [Nocardia alba]TCJ99456.1 S-formylglutathione hydrolase FrmB [Nocardia alba]